MPGHQQLQHIPTIGKYHKATYSLNCSHISLVTSSKQVTEDYPSIEDADALTQMCARSSAASTMTYSKAYHKATYSPNCFHISLTASSKQATQYHPVWEWMLGFIINMHFYSLEITSTKDPDSITVTPRYNITSSQKQHKKKYQMTALIILRHINCTMT